MTGKQFRLGTMQELREFLGLKEANVKTIRIDPGTEVVCDLCNKDWTNRPESGGIYGLSTKAICPDCAPQVLKDAEEFGELKYVKARCPPDKSFANWVREDLR